MRTSLYMLAFAAPFLAGAALPPMVPAPRAKQADIVDVNFLTRLFEGDRPSSERRRGASRSREGGVAIPKPPALAQVPVPLPKPEEAKPEGPKPEEPKPEEQRQAEAQTPPPPAAPATTSEPPQPDLPAQPPQADAQAPVSTASEAQANPPVAAQVPIPQPKPEEKPSPDLPAANATAAGPEPGGQEEDKEKQEDKAEAPPPPPPPPLVKENPEELKACLAELTTLGAKFQPTDPIDEGNGCGIEHPIDVAEVLPGVDLGGATMRCKTAVTMAHWLKDTVQPAMTIAMPGRRIVGLVPGSTYACRLRNSASTGKLSEHARGNAFDVAAFKLDNGETIEMKPRDEDSTLEGAFQRTATAGACLHFTTVLSPGSDAAHETHLHLDVMERRDGYRYCR